MGERPGRLLHSFKHQEILNQDPGRITMVAEVDVSSFKSNQAGVIIRRGAGMKGISILIVISI